MTPEEIISWKPFLKRISLFEGLADADLEAVAVLLKPLSLPRGGVLFNQGDAAESFYVVTSGTVELRVERHGKVDVAGYIGRGDSLGELALLTGEPRSSTAALETSCEFLVLSREDFAKILNENPSILLQLSRMLSSQLTQGSRSAEQAAAAHPRLIAVLAPTAPALRSFFVSALAGFLAEQAKRRVLLVDMDPSAERLCRHFGIEPRPVEEKDLLGRDFHDPKLLQELVQVHASGLGILTISPQVLSGRLFRSVFLLMNLLRDHSDFVILSLGDSREDVEKSVLYESDRWILIGDDASKDAFSRAERELIAWAPDQARMLNVWLGDRMPRDAALASRTEWTRVPWPAELSAKALRGDSPFSALEQFPSSRRGVEGLARRFARLRVGIALGTGAALGYALIGILKRFEREAVPIDLIAGTSIGSFVGGLSALGLSAERIEEIALGVDKAWMYENLFWDMTVPKAGFFAGTTLLRFIRSYFGDAEFGDLERPFRCVATDIETGEEVVFHDGPVAPAIRASCGIPMIFNPFHYRGRFLVDGGLVDPVPVRVVSQMGAEILISVNLTMPAGERKSALRSRRGGASGPIDLSQIKDLSLPSALLSPNMLQILFQTIYTMEYEIAKSRAGLAHINIHPDLSRFSWTELHRAKEIIAAGEEIAEAVMPKIKSFLPQFSATCRVDPRKARWTA